MNAQTKVERSTLNDAVAACMADIKPLAKGETNSHASYNFASVDDFLNLTRPICAKHGLTIRQDEEHSEIQGGQLHMRFAFTLHHGDEMAGPYRRSITVNSKMGSQAYGAAQSYALKQYLRSLFQISTGDKEDVDHHEPQALQDHTPKREKWTTPITSKTALKAACRSVHAELERLATESTLDDLEAYLTSPEYQDYITTALEHSPFLLEGPLPPEFPPEYVQTYALEASARDRIALRSNQAMENA
ncbi:MAG: ERF family protein [Pseudomonadota bacterium]